jgi:hypothetical protein
VLRWRYHKGTIGGRLTRTHRKQYLIQAWSGWVVGGHAYLDAADEVVLEEVDEVDLSDFAGERELGHVLAEVDDTHGRQIALRQSEELGDATSPELC